MGNWDRKDLFGTCSSGLCNRLLTLAGSLRIAALEGRNFSLYWPLNHSLGCRFERLFANRFRMITERDLHIILDTCLTVKVYNAWRYNGPTYKQLSPDGDPDANVVIIKGWGYPMLATDHYGADLDREVRRHLLSLVPLPEILAEVDAFCLPARSIGVHVRRGDCLETFGQSKDEYFRALMQGIISLRPDVTFFFATHEKGTEDRFRQEFGERLCCFPKSGAARQEERGGQEALIDLLLLSRTAAIIGNVASSYSSTAARLGGKTFVVADENTAHTNLERTCTFLASRLPTPDQAPCTR